MVASNSAIKRAKMMMKKMMKAEGVLNPRAVRGCTSDRARGR
jgi:hypothetical protein